MERRRSGGRSPAGCRGPGLAVPAAPLLPRPRPRRLRLQVRARDPGEAEAQAQARPSGCHPARSLRTPRVEAAEAPHALRPPTTSRRRGEGGGRPARWTPDPGTAAASSFKLAVTGVTFPAEPRHPLPSPHLQGRLGARGWRGTRAREAEAGGGGVSWRGRPVSSRRPRELSAAPAIMAFLLIRALGGEGRGTYHARTFATPPSVAEHCRQRGCE